MGHRYTVTARFSDAAVAEEWLEWLRNGHCQAVLDGGATRAEVLQLQATPVVREVRYDFPDPATFAHYEQHHAPALRAEGLTRFPTERGIVYGRTVGMVVAALP